jgi:hypothetical protein
MAETETVYDLRDEIDQRLTAADLARELSAGGSTITEAQVQAIAERGKLIAADGKISLLEYTAFLVQAIAQGKL